MTLQAETRPVAVRTYDKLSIIIPAFNEAAGIGSVLARLEEWKTRGAEIIVVDDGSTDQTGHIAAEAGARVIRHGTNRGYGAALKSGIRNAHGELVVTLDSDGQHDPRDIERLLAALGDNEMVVGARGGGSHSPPLRRPGKWILGKVANYLADTEIPDINSGFRVVRRRTAMQFLHILPNGFSFSTTITLAMFKEGYGVAYIPITASPRVGTSTVKPMQDGFNTILLIIRTISLFDPLKVFLPASVLLFLFGLAYWILDSIMLGRPNIPSGAVLVLVSSILVFLFGILADQVSALRREKRD